MDDQASSNSVPQDALVGTYTGQTGPLFRLAVKTALLTVLTLGIYRFWEKTRIRRFIWSATAPGGDAFEYTGTGLEKFLGFLIAVVILSATLGIIQLGLMFWGLSVFDPGETPQQQAFSWLALNLSFVPVMPLYFFAMYRARRYRMARTRWRGIRFGVLPGAWGYAWRAALLLIVTCLSLGMLWPLMTFRLEKYQTDRTFFGDARWHQGGHWAMLYSAMTHLFIALGILVFCGVCLSIQEPIPAFVLIPVGCIWGIVGLVHYRVQSYAILARHKTIGDGIHLGAAPRTGEVIKIYILGALLTSLIVMAVNIVFGMALAALALVVPGVSLSMDGWAMPMVVQIVGPFLGLSVTFSIYGVGYLVFIQQKVHAHYVTHTWVENPIVLTSVKQRTADDFADADGFADALDVGGGF